VQPEGGARDRLTRVAASRSRAGEWSNITAETQQLLIRTSWKHGTHALLLDRPGQSEQRSVVHSLVRGTARSPFIISPADNVRT
jgi:hypothetical protein